MEKDEKTLKRVGDDTLTTSGKSSQSVPGPGSPDCPHCFGLGYIGPKTAPDDPNFGRLLPCSCRLEEIASAQDSERRQMSSLGPLASKTFDKFLPHGHATDEHHRDSLQRAYEQTRSFAEAPRGWILLHGGYGCGKTHLAAAISNHCLDAGSEVMFVNTPDLLDHLRATFSPGSDVGYDELFEQVRGAPLLILDDLGAESPTQWAQEKLYQIINHRYNAQLPTVLTCNVELERIEPRVRSRLVDMDLVRKIVIDAPDFRRAESDQTDLSSLDLHTRQRFDNLDLRKGEISAEHQKRLRDAYESARQFAETPSGWLVLTGGHGCGKTHMAAAIANHRVSNGHPALFITAADLLDHLRATFSPDSLVRFDKQFGELRNSPLLVLDALTLESATPWAREKLMQLIDHRYVAELPTVITTSSDRSDLGAWMETRLLDPRLSVVCPITAPIYRRARTRSSKRKL